MIELFIKSFGNLFYNFNIINNINDIKTDGVYIYNFYLLSSVGTLNLLRNIFATIGFRICNIGRLYTDIVFT